MGAVTMKLDVMHGLPVVAGTRIPVRALASFRDAGYSLSGIMDEYPDLTTDQITEALSWWDGHAA